MQREERRWSAIAVGAAFAGKIDEIFKPDRESASSEIERIVADAEEDEDFMGHIRANMAGARGD